MKHLLLTLLAAACASATLAQPARTSSTLPAVPPAVSGRVTDAATGAAIDFADVVVTDNDNNTVATAVVQNGRFAIAKVREGEYTLTILLVGYQPFVRELTFRSGEPIDLGTVELAMVETGLQEVTVTGHRSKIVYKLDRQRINASSVLSAAGGTAVDVLNSTPSVRVDADGEVSFRGSTGFLVYVDGKPSMFEGTQALQQIAAADIEDIEIITTPSARYRTDGDAGIINVITKRRSDEGVQKYITICLDSKMISLHLQHQTHI